MIYKFKFLNEKKCFCFVTLEQTKKIKFNPPPPPARKF